jgi:MinD-like ATPase involved in chromosome partitioning or flagellar assembly
VPLDLGSVPPAPSTPPAGWLADAPAAPVPPAAASDDPAAVPGEAAASAEIGYQPRGSVQEEPDAGPADVGSEAPAVSERRSRSEGPESATSLTSDRLVAKSPAAPVGGWRRWLYFATFGYVNVGDSDAVRMQRALEHRIAVRLGEKTRYVPVLSRKGGVGKTTVTTLLGMALADLREDRVIAMDANPDRGTLSDRNPGRASHTARQLVKDRFEVNSFAQLSNYTAREGSRLDVLASDADPMVAHAFNDADYRAVTDILGRYYSIVLTDSGTGMVHSVMQGTLEKADAVVLVSGGSVDEARLASETLSWLEAHGRDDLVRKAIVVVNVSAGSGTRVNVDEIEEHFRTRVGHVVRIPHDRHLAEGSQIEFAKLGAATREAAIELAGLVVDQLTD